LTVLVVTDDPSVFRVLTEAFAAYGFESIQVVNNQDFVKEFYQCLPDVVVIEDRLSFVDKVDLCSWIRQLVYIPLILVGRDHTDAQALKGLHRGADMYVGTEFSPTELMARVDALLRRRHNYWETLRQSFNTEERSVRVGPRGAIRLSPTEFRLLSFMLLSRHRSITPAEMLGHVWAGKKGHEDSVRFYLRRLRDKLEHESDWRIVSRRGSGYRLVVGPSTGLGLLAEHRAGVPSRRAKAPSVSPWREPEYADSSMSPLGEDGTGSQDNATVP